MTDENRPITAEDLVRAIRLSADTGSTEPVFELAEKMGFQFLHHSWFSYTSAIEQIADLITLPKQEQAAEAS